MMIDVLHSTATLTDDELLSTVSALAQHERQATARLVAALVEMDCRRLYLGQGCSSLFTYCTQVLHLSEHAAYGRIEAARAARKFPLILDLLADGSVHLTAIGLLSPHLTEDNHATVLAAARHKTKHEIEKVVAALRPAPPVPATIRKLPIPRSVPATPAASATPMDDALTFGERAAADPPLRSPSPQTPRAEVKPLGPEYYKVQFTASQETYAKLRLAQDLLRHTIPRGDVAAVIDRALTLLVEELQRTKYAAVDRPRPVRSSTTRVSGRYIPAAVRREVLRRDGGQCAFVGAAGRCTERGFLEHHHRGPFADGGAATVDNIEVRCRAHNTYEAERWSGSDLVREPAAILGLDRGRFARDGGWYWIKARVPLTEPSRLLFSAPP
jgi:hypothetical protein